MWPVYYLFERKWHEKFQIWKILNFIHVHFGTTCKIFNFGLQRELMGAKCLQSDRNKWNSVNHFWFHEKWCATKLFSSNYVNVWLIILTTWNVKMQEKLQFLDHQIVTSCIAIVIVVFLLFIWKEMAWKILNLENLEFYTCTLWDHNAKFLILAYRGNSWVPNVCILVGINETKWTTFDFMRNDVLQNYLVQFL